MIQQAVRRILDGAELTPSEVEGTVREIAEGRAAQSQISAFLVALSQRGETPDEIAAFASTLREYSVRITPQVAGRLVDTCGTGGDRAKTFNVSTISALVAAGAGASVAKHGNRSVTSRCGSADVLERLGLNLEVSPEVVKETIERVGVGFMFAPSFHPAMRHVAQVRKELGIRTVFNLIGPLINPAGADAQVVGVYSPELVEKVAKVFRKLGSKEVLVVHALEGMDEISVSGKTLVSWLKNGEIRTHELEPSDFGMEKRPPYGEEVQGVDEGARIALGILEGRMKDSSLTDMVVLNSSAALMVAGEADGFRGAVDMARESLESGAALGKLRDLIRSSGGDVSRVELYATSK
jgi:anthranilate phosphoribosyltransferase